MAGVGDKIDLTSNLPDELLWKVFDYLPLRGKLRLESVSHRFQKIILDLLKRPYRLEVHPYSKTLNGYKIRLVHLSEALWALASKSKFSRIKIGENWLDPERETERTEHMDSLLAVLLVTNCLDKVVSFECNYGPSQDICEKIFAQCVKLSKVRLCFAVRPPNIQLDLEVFWKNRIFPLDLSTLLLNTKALTELDLKLTGYPQDRLVELFHSLKPHSLQKLRLMFYKKVPPLDLTEIVRQLSTNAWGGLAELRIGWERTTAHIDLAKFFESLTLIPSLNICNIIFERLKKNTDRIEPGNQFVAAMTSLLKRSDINIRFSPRTPGILGLLFPTLDCVAVANIRELQKVFPNLIVHFSVGTANITIRLSMDNKCFEEWVCFEPCGIDGCLECYRFYPMVFGALLEKAEHREDLHLEDYQLDRCRINKVADDLNNCNDDRTPWLAVSAEVEGDLVTIGFEFPYYEDEDNKEQYSITVDCGCCFNNSCIRCVNVE